MPATSTLHCWGSLAGIFLAGGTNAAPEQSALNRCLLTTRHRTPSQVKSQPLLADAFSVRWRVALIVGTLLVLALSAGVVWHTDSYDPGPCRTPGTSSGAWHAKPSAKCTAARTAHKRSRMLSLGAGAAVILTACLLAARHPPSAISDDRAAARSLRVISSSGGDDDPTPQFDPEPTASRQTDHPSPLITVSGRLRVHGPPPLLSTDGSCAGAVVSTELTQ